MRHRTEVQKAQRQNVKVESGIFRQLLAFEVQDRILNRLSCHYKLALVKITTSYYYYYIFV